MINFNTVYPKIEHYLKQEKVFLSKLLHLDIVQNKTALLKRLQDTEDLEATLIQNPSISNIDFQEMGNQLYQMDKTSEGIIFMALFKENASYDRCSKITIPLYNERKTL